MTVEIKGSLNNIFQDSFNKILSQQLTHDRSYMSAIASNMDKSKILAERPVAQSIALRAGEQGVEGSIPGSANILSEDGW